jgi:hypothetical protein
MSGAGEKSWITRRKNEKKEQQKWRKAQEIADKTGKNAVTFTKVQLDKHGWKHVEFKSKRGYPRTGIIDLVAFRLDKKDPDKLKMILFQVKGGLQNRVKEEHITRLKEAVKKVEIAINWAEKPEKSVRFDWEPTYELFDLHTIKK